MSKYIIVLITFFGFFVISETEKNGQANRESDVDRYDPMKCFSRCLVQKRCGFVVSNNTGCVLYDEELLDLRKNECPETRLEKSLLPGALAGACADHTCGMNELCQALSGGGFKCVSARHGSPCSTHSDCGRDLTCRLDRCSCHTGYHYHPNTDKCTRRCVKTGYGFDAFPEKAITGHNDKRIERASYTTCLSLCLGNDVKCKTVDWRNDTGHCCLSELGFFEVSVFYRESKAKNYILFVRRCL